MVHGETGGSQALQLDEPACGQHPERLFFPMAGALQLDNLQE